MGRLRDVFRRWFVVTGCWVHACLPACMRDTCGDHPVLPPACPTVKRHEASPSIHRSITTHACHMSAKCLPHVSCTATIQPRGTRIILQQAESYTSGAAAVGTCGEQAGMHGAGSLLRRWHGLSGMPPSSQGVPGSSCSRLRAIHQGLQQLVPAGEQAGMHGIFF